MLVYRYAHILTTWQRSTRQTSKQTDLAIMTYVQFFLANKNEKLILQNMMMLEKRSFQVTLIYLILKL